MLVHFGIDQIQAEWAESVVCVGTFDGVHLGHQALIKKAVAIAKESSVPCIVLTFDRHPLSVIAPERAPAAIGTLEQNIQAVRKLGPGLCVVLPFNRHTAETTAQEFFDDVVCEALKAKAIVIGHDFAFGHDRQGDGEWLSARIETHVLPPVTLDEKRVSSSAVRAAVSMGDTKTAQTLLGRPFALRGLVVKGKQLGRTIGFPTANLARTSSQLTPADGIYACTATTSAGTFKAAVSIGYRPAVNGTERTIEAYLLDYPGTDIYGEPIELAFHAFLRPESDFPDLEALKMQIAADVALVGQTVAL